MRRHSRVDSDRRFLKERPSKGESTVSTAMPTWFREPGCRKTWEPARRFATVNCSGHPKNKRPASPPADGCSCSTASSRLGLHDSWRRAHHSPGEPGRLRARTERNDQRCCAWPRGCCGPTSGTGWLAGADKNAAAMPGPRRECASCQVDAGFSLVTVRDTWSCRCRPAEDANLDRRHGGVPSSPSRMGTGSRAARSGGEQADARWPGPYGAAEVICLTRFVGLAHGRWLTGC